MSHKWIFEPYIGVGLVKFGMNIKGVEKILGMPRKAVKMSGQEIREFRDNIIVIYSVDNQTVEEISCLPGKDIFFHDRNLLQDDLIAYLKHFDKEPYEFNGIIVFFKLGIAITGYHDNDESQKNITFFKRGIWDVLKPKLRLYIG